MANQLKINPQTTGVTPGTALVRRAVVLHDKDGNDITASNPSHVALNTNNATGDAFGRLRVSQPQTLFDSKQIFDNQPLFWDDQQVSGTGTGSTHSQATASSTLTVDNLTAGKRVRQTFRRFNYQPGKSQLILMTGVLNQSGGGTGIIQAFGAFDDNNGLFLQNNEGTIQFVNRTSTSGSPVDIIINQAVWNIDTMDGTGPSGITIDFSKTQILVIDYEWLGVGRVRMGFNIDGVTYYCHQFLNANSLNVVYMSTPNLPLRYSIENDGNGGVASLQHICTSVQSEGGQDPTGTLRHIDSGTIGNLLNNSVYAMLGIRLQATKLGAVIDLLNTSLIATTNNDQVHWEIRFNPTVAGTFTYSDQTNSAVQTAIGTNANTVTGGIQIDGGFFSTAQIAVNALENALRLGAAIDGTRDELVLCVIPITNNIAVNTSITWRELS